MKFYYKEDTIFFFFSHNEIEKAYFFLQLAIARQEEKGNIISILPLEKILEQTGNTKKEIPLEFKEGFKEFGIDFIIEMIEFHKKEGSDSLYLDTFLSKIDSSYNPTEITLH